MFTERNEIEMKENQHIIEMKAKRNHEIIEKLHDVWKEIIDIPQNEEMFTKNRNEEYREAESHRPRKSEEKREIINEEAAAPREKKAQINGEEMKSYSIENRRRREPRLRPHIRRKINQHQRGSPRRKSRENRHQHQSISQQQKAKKKSREKNRGKSSVDIFASSRKTSCEMAKYIRRKSIHIINLHYSILPRHQSSIIKRKWNILP